MKSKNAVPAWTARVLRVAAASDILVGALLHQLARQGDGDRARLGRQSDERLLILQGHGGPLGHAVEGKDAVEAIREQLRNLE